MTDENRHSVRPPAWLTPSAFVLIAANLVPLAGAILLEWTVFEIFVLFWAENLIIGVLNVLRMLIASAGDAVGWGLKLFLVPFFAFHYGMFTFGHGVFVFTLFGSSTFGADNFPDHPGGMLVALSGLGVGVPLLALALSHGFSFLWNYLGRGEYRNANVMLLMMRPYGRIVVLHVTLIIGGFILLSLGSPLGGLVLLILLKIGFDLRAHRKEHRDKMEPETANEPTFRQMIERFNAFQRQRRRIRTGMRLKQTGREP